MEDLHWSDASTLEFLGQLISGGERGGILTILTFRPEFKIPWPAAPHQTVLALNRLSRRQVTEWMRTGSSKALPESLVTQIYQRTGGVPLLVEEFTRMVRESVVDGPAGAGSGTETTSPKEIPATLQDLVMGRLDRMACDREIAWLTATLGHRFDYELLAATATAGETTLRAELTKLVSAGVLYSKGQWPRCSYIFKHGLLEEALYTAIDEQRRREFHQRIAEAMEKQFPNAVEMQPEVLAEHCTKAGLVEKAVRYCLKAGLRSRDRFANVEAASHLQKGLQWLETLEPSAERDALELDLLAPLGTAYIAWRGYADPEVDPILRRARSCGAILRTILCAVISGSVPNWLKNRSLLPNASTIRISSWKHFSLGG